MTLNNKNNIFGEIDNEEAKYEFFVNYFRWTKQNSNSKIRRI
jgi:hypothetical protein